HVHRRRRADVVDQPAGKGGPRSRRLRPSLPERRQRPAARSRSGTDGVKPRSQASVAEAAAPRSAFSEVALVSFAAVALTVLFWSPLWLGGGLIGGDIYPYSLPQKAWLADSLKAGVIPLWNPLTGHGYPVLGESQTGALYPLHLVVYALCDVGTGWNVVLIA